MRTLFVLAALATAAPAAAAVTPERAAKELGSDPVWVEPGASPSLDVSERGQLRLAIVREQLGRIRIAVVSRDSAQAAGGIARFGDQVWDALGVRGTLVTTAGGDYHLSYDFPEGPRIRPALQSLIARHGAGRLFAVLDPAVRRIADIDPLGPRQFSAEQPDVPEPPVPGAAPDTGASQDDAIGDQLDEVFKGVEEDVGDVLGVAKGVAIAIGIAVVLAILVPILFAFRRARSERALAERREELNRQDVRDQLAEVGEGIRALDLDHSMPGADAEGSAAYAAAVEAYDRAETLLDRREADGVDFQRARAELTEAQHRLAIAQERFGAAKAPGT